MSMEWCVYPHLIVYPRAEPPSTGDFERDSSWWDEEGPFLLGDIAKARAPHVISVRPNFGAIGVRKHSLGNGYLIGLEVKVTASSAEVAELRSMRFMLRAQQITSGGCGGAYRCVSTIKYDGCPFPASWEDHIAEEGDLGEDLMAVPETSP